MRPTHSPKYANLFRSYSSENRQDKPNPNRAAVKKNFDNVVNYLFIFGFITSKLRDIAFILLSTIFGIISIFAYLFGYLLWFCSTLLTEHSPRNYDVLGQLTNSNDHYRIASLLGIIGCIMCISLPPIFLIPALLIFNISNFFWSMAEFHKLRYPLPPNIDPLFSSQRQKLYLYYVMGMAGSTIITTISALIIFFNPALTLVATMLTLSAGNVLTLGAFYSLSNTFQEFKPDHSYCKLASQLNFELKRKRTTVVSYHDQFIPQPKKMKIEKQVRPQIIEDPCTTSTHGPAFN